MRIEQIARSKKILKIIIILQARADLNFSSLNKCLETLSGNACEWLPIKIEGTKRCLCVWTSTICVYKATCQIERRQSMCFASSLNPSLLENFLIIILWIMSNLWSEGSRSLIINLKEILENFDKFFTKLGYCAHLLALKELFKKRTNLSINLKQLWCLFHLTLEL
ncbi:hypothetical protein BpHYR1_031238 [Brachionus plicatilis]|uniref:Uncharacterized protein n=1 Tax=Brachionus plicatilis TaxID=10195 RepID=A0A3M7S080_BRAPC|nr:hypothetical protein BpHYR1_031238 [Brachionus plicatilis]